MKKASILIALTALTLSCVSEKPIAPLKVEACAIRFHGMLADVGFLTYLSYELQTNQEGKVVKITPIDDDRGAKGIFTYDELVACLKRWALEPGRTYTLTMDLSNAQPLVWDLWLDKRLVLSLTWDDKCNRPIPSIISKVE